MPEFRPRSRQEGFITILKEPHYLIRYSLVRDENTNELKWLNEDGSDTGIEPVIVWQDEYVSSIDWGMKPKNIPITQAGFSTEINETVGYEPSLSFRSALISRQFYKTQKFRTKWRILLEYKEDKNSYVYDSYQFPGAVQDDYSVSGDSLLEQSISFKVEDIPEDE